MADIIITRSQAGRTVVELLRSHFRLNPDEVKALLRKKGIRLDRQVCHDLTWRVRAGQRLFVDHAGNTRPAKKTKTDDKLPQLARDIRIVHCDDHIVVVDKPAGLTTVRHAADRAEFGNRAQRFLPSTLIDLLGKVLATKLAGKIPRLRAVHRLDKETTGLVVVARTPEAERHLGLQFREHNVERTYLALVRGQAKDETITSYLVEDRGDGRRGSGDKGKGQKAVTHVHVVETLGDCTLVECRLETGRTHQVRIHLGEQGTPLCGERVYDRPLHGRKLPDASGALRPLLHGATLAFEHPATGERVNFTSPMPRDMRDLIER